MWTASSSCSFEVPTSIRESYNAELARIRDLVKAKSPPQRPAQRTLALLAAQRLAWIVAAAGQHMSVFIAVGLVQFVVAPYSFAGAFMTGLMYLLTMCLGHLLTALLFALLPLPDVSITLDNGFIACFLLVDFSACCYFSFMSTMAGRPKGFPLVQTLWHMVYGTFNCKSYFLLVFLPCRGTRFNLAWLALDAVLGLGAIVNSVVQRSPPAWEVLFYNAHRLGHLPMVYDHAHKTHHYLHDTTAFDAHLFSGSGFPEEWFLLFYDLFAIRVLGVPPPVLSWRMLKYQLGGKEGHQRKDESFGWEQYHEDHHTVHRANFGVARPMLDMYFGTYKREAGTVELAEAAFTQERLGDSHVRFIVRTRGEDGGSFDAGTEQDLPWWWVQLIGA